MTTLVLSHRACLAHDPGPGHPESPARLAAVLKGLERWQVAGAGGLALDWAEAPAAGRDALELVHSRVHVDRVLDAVPARGYAHLDPDTALGPASGEAALAAVGALTAAVDAVMERRARAAFAAVRPPGHHAGPARAMGFCVFNNIAIAALHARKAHRLRRVAVVDFDVHHGNGTEEIFRGDEDLFFASSHQFPNYPGTGSGRDDNGHILNVPLRPGSAGAAFRAGWSERLLPALRDFGPELILISAGFDGHTKDPLAHLNLVEADFAWVTAAIRAVADDCCQGRLVSTLEGGYDLDALAASAVAHVEALTGASAD